VATARPFLSAGRWQHTATTAKIFNPFDGRVLAEVCQAGPGEIEAAIQSTIDGARLMRNQPGHVRSALLHKIADLLDARRDDCARIIAEEAGKPITDARREVGRAVQTFTVAAEEAKRIGGEVVPLDWTPGTEAYWGVTRRFPLGAILGITPFNFPINLVAHKVAPALAAGNAILIKPAPQTPLTALFLGELALEAGLPAGALNIVPCANEMAGRLVADARFKLLSFTGSAQVGWMLKSKSGKKKVVLELGGNAGVIIEPDADLDLAAQRCATGGFAYAGQTCISVQRILVHESIVETFTAKLLALVSQLKSGDPCDEATVVGPLINSTATERVEGWIKEAVAQGATVLAGATRTGSVLNATVLSHVNATMKVSCEEVFGPLVTITPYTKFEQALALLNNSPYGLQAGLFTQDIDRIFSAFRNLEVGAVLVNDVPTFRADHMPYGGVKDSGMGREGVKYAIDEMTEPRLLVLNLRRPSS
jgi:glyceraldehyde-3-phosphate dehydrogenase (NADP+)